MRSLSGALLIVCFATPVASRAQSSAPKPIRCAIVAAMPPSEADLAFAAGDTAHAESLYSAQIATAPGPAYAGLVRSQLEQNKLIEALATAQRAASASPGSAEAESLVGDALARSGQIPEASAAYAKAINLNQCSPRAHFGVGRLNELVARHATAAHELALAHGLAPADPEITVAWLDTLPAGQRAASLGTLLQSHPIVAPGVAARLSTQLALLDQHKTCTAVESPANAKLDLAALMLNGLVERSWGVNVRFNDSANPLLELDSSVSGIVLNPKDAQRAGVHPLTTGAAPPDAPYTGVADHIRIGPLEYRDCPVRVVPSANLASYNSLIGTDFFRDHLIHIDYVAKLLILAPYPVNPSATAGGPADQYIAPTEKDWSQIYVSGDKILIPTLINKKGPYLFLLDTGIGTTVLSPSVASTLSASSDATVNLYGVSGEIVKVIPREGATGLNRSDVTGTLIYDNNVVPQGGDLYIASVYGPTGKLLRVTRPSKLPLLRFTANEHLDPSAVSFDISPLSHETGSEISGLLGFGVLSNFFIDINYRDALARIQFDQNRRYESRQHAKSDHNLSF